MLLRPRQKLFVERSRLSLATGQPEAALAPLELALELTAESGLYRALVELELAHALGRAGREGERSEALRAAAHARLQAMELDAARFERSMQRLRDAGASARPKGAPLGRH